MGVRKAGPMNLFTSIDYSSSTYDHNIGKKTLNIIQS